MTIRRLHRPRRSVALDSERKPVLGRVVGGASISLDAGNVETETPKWQHVATVGTFKGYGGGEAPFAFTDQTFAEIVRNFRSHPSYKAGPDGFGTVGIVQWDFHHASEAPPDVVAQLGAPAQGWVLDLQTKPGPNGTELWALTEWLPLAAGYIKAGQYKWASVAVALEAVDPVTGEKIGAILTSIAITNQPFIEGMAELAAAKNAKPGATPPAGLADRRANVKAAYRAYSREEAMNCIRDRLGLPVTATNDEVKSNLMALAGMLSGGEALEEQTGIDADKVVDDIKTILGLPLLTLPAKIMSDALSLFDTEEIETGGDTETGNGDGESIPGATTASRKTSTISAEAGKQKETMDLIKKLAATLGVQENESAVVSAVEGLTGVRLSLTSTLDLDRNISDARLSESVKGITKLSRQRRALLALVSVLATATFAGGKVKLAGKHEMPDGSEMDDDDPAMKPGKGDALVQRLGALMAAGGVEDPDRAVAQIVKTLTDAAKLEEVMPELEELRKFSAEAKAEDENDAVAATLRDYYNGDEDHREVVLAFYRSAGKKKFLEKYPALDAGVEGLTRTIAAEANSGGRPRTRTAEATRETEPTTPASPGPTAVRASKKGQLAEGVVDISLYPGANDSEKAINALKATVQGSEKWDYDTICATAFQARKDGRFVNLSAGR